MDQVGVQPSATEIASRVEFSADPSRYRHWRVSYDGPVATVAMEVDPQAPLRSGYELKLNSYDLGVDIELADIVRRMRFEHPEVRTVVLTSGSDKVFCAGANIHMLGSSSHAWKVNFCKFTNETRCEIEDATANSGQVYIAACNGTTAGGGYELALACSEIHLIDDGASAVSLPEVPLLGVLPGTGGLTRLVDKRKVRRDRADVFSTTAEGIRGRRAVQWNLVDAIHPRSKFDEAIGKRATELAENTAKDLVAGERKGVTLDPLEPELGERFRQYRHVRLQWNDAERLAELTIQGPEKADVDLARQGGEALHAAGADMWALRAYRELDDALLHLRINHMNIGLILVRTGGDPGLVLQYDEALLEAALNHWFAREIVLLMGRTLRRMDNTTRSFFALGDAGTAFAGSFLELALASDRFYVLDDPDSPVKLGLGPMNWGPLSMHNGTTRLQTHLIGETGKLSELEGRYGLLDPEQADEAGLVTVLLDELDWDDDTRVAIEERLSLSPDALSGMEQNLRFAGRESTESKIYARLSAWQNWIFIRPNATGPQGALTLYGRPERPHFDWNRV